MGKPLAECSLVRPRRWHDNIKMYLTEVFVMGCGQKRLEIVSSGGLCISGVCGKLRRLASYLGHTTGYTSNLSDLVTLK